jgi:hypothetical protein
MGLVAPTCVRGPWRGKGSEIYHSYVNHFIFFGVGYLLAVEHLVTTKKKSYIS